MVALQSGRRIWEICLILPPFGGGLKGKPRGSCDPFVGLPRTARFHSPGFG